MNCLFQKIPLSTDNNIKKLIYFKTSQFTLNAGTELHIRINETMILIECHNI